MNLSPSSPLVILTGAGISAESGISTFRDAGGLWEQHPIEEVATPKGFRRNPELVHRFYSQRRAQLHHVAPNAAHEALARLEKAWRGDFMLVTQNVDDLHERAGSRNLIHMHGELRKLRCASCSSIFHWKGPADARTPCPVCDRSETLRPHIVWFGEMPLELERIYQALASCAAFISIGTSGKVYPAAGFIQAIHPTAQSLEMNLELGEISHAFQEHCHGPATRTVTALVQKLMESTL